MPPIISTCSGGAPSGGVGDRGTFGDPLRVENTVAQRQLRFFSGVKRGKDPVRRFGRRQSLPVGRGV